MKTESSSNKDIIIQILSATGRPGMDRILAELEQNGFYEAPGSIKYHSNYKGGLAEHSLAVYRCAMDLKRTNPKVYGSVSEESIAVTALLHDICKCDVYKKNTKMKRGIFGTREESSSYTVSYNDFPMGHGEKSVILALAGGLELYDSEMVAIRWHMGAWRLNQDDNEEKQNYKAATDRFPLVTILQTADTLAARIIE